MSNIIHILRQNHQKKVGGLVLSNRETNDVLAVVERNGKQMFVNNSVQSKKTAITVPSMDYIVYPHIPLGLETFRIFISGQSGMGKSSLTRLFIEQTYKHITKKIFYICGTDIKSDISIAPLKYVKQIDGELLEDINVERDFENSLIVFDDIDSWSYHKQAISILNSAYETGRKFKINIIYISHITSKASESKIYGEIDMYITNKAKNNRMFEHHLSLNKHIIEEIDEYLKTDPFVCYNKRFNAVITDKKVYKINE